MTSPAQSREDHTSTMYAFYAPRHLALGDEFDALALNNETDRVLWRVIDDAAASDLDETRRCAQVALGNSAGEVTIVAIVQHSPLEVEHVETLHCRWIPDAVWDAYWQSGTFRP